MIILRHKSSNMVKVIILLSIFTCQLKAQNTDIDHIKMVLADQANAWNTGNIDDFMLGYWQSDSLTFVGSSGLTKGWSKTLANYKKNYSTKDKMGILHFEILKLDLISSDAAYMLGRYTLTRINDKPTGHFTLIWKKIKGRWVIISDQTCG